MNLVPMFDVEDFPENILEAFENFQDALQDYDDVIEWNFNMSNHFKQSISDDVYENFRTVSDYLLDELAQEDISEDFVIIRT